MTINKMIVRGVLTLIGVILLGVCFATVFQYHDHKVQKEVQVKVEEVQQEADKKIEQKNNKIEQLQLDQQKLKEEYEEKLKKQREEIEVSRAASRYRARYTGFEVTYYNTYGKTASGRITEDGVSVAVDPNLIPLGSWIEIVFPDGRKIIRRADDTGGVVVGRVVDIYVDESTAAVYRLGRKHNVTVNVLNRQP